MGLKFMRVPPEKLKMFSGGTLKENLTAHRDEEASGRYT
jgi:hypothetical protein